MPRERHTAVPRDFVLIERDGGPADDGLIGVRGALRSTWSMPTDTFVTADIPLLLTRLSTVERGDR